VQSQYSKVLNFDAPSELEFHCRSPKEDIFTFVLENDAINVSTKIFLLDYGKGKPDTHQILCHRLVMKGSNGHSIKKISS
jgi:hypothetical protein